MPVVVGLYAGLGGVASERDSNGKIYLADNATGVTKLVKLSGTAT